MSALMEVLEREARAETRPVAIEPATLEEALQALAIRPYSAESVRKYKRRMVRRHTWLRESFAARLSNCLFCLTGLIAGSFLLSLLWLTASLFSANWTLALSVFWLCGALFASLCLLCAILDRLAYTEAVWAINYPDWESARLPQYVLDTREKVRNFYPDARFATEELWVRSEVVDPFLVVRDTRFPDSPWIYLEVWDEEDFA